MKVFGGASIRNVAVVGHGSSGKTSLVAGCLFLGGVGNRLGRVDDGTALTDFDPEEIERKISISTAIASSEWNKTKINFLDTPGKGVFIQDTRTSMRVSEAALVLVDAVAGVEVQTEKVFKFSEEFNLAAAFVVNKLDRDNASFERAVDSLQENFGRTCIPIHLPIGSEKGFRGIVDLVDLRAYEYEPNGSGKAKVIDIPPALQDAASKGHEAIVEMVAEGNDHLMEEFFDKGTIPLEDLVPGLKQAIAERKIHPVLASSALTNVGPQALLDFIVNYLPSPVGAKTIPAATSAQGTDAVARITASDGPLSVFVFKTLADPFAGQALLSEGFWRYVEDRSYCIQPQPWHVRATGSPRHPTRKNPGRSARTPCRRHWRCGEAERYGHCRHAR